MTITRRTLLTIGMVLIADQATGRGMYCTRHRVECERRRQREREEWERWAEQETKRRAALTPEQRRVEDLRYAQKTTEFINREAAKVRHQSMVKQSGNPALKVFGGFCAFAAVFFSGVIWMTKR